MKTLFTEWVDVVSTNLEEVDYNNKTKDLQIKFKNSPVIYIFKNVPGKTYAGMMWSRSKGGYFSRNIKNKFNFIKINKTTKMEKRNLKESVSIPEEIQDTAREYKDQGMNPRQVVEAILDNPSFRKWFNKEYEGGNEFNLRHDLENLSPEQLEESGLGFDSIADQMYEEFKMSINWEDNVRGELKKMMLGKDTINRILDKLHGEDYFDDGQMTFDSEEDDEDYFSESVAPKVGEQIYWPTRYKNKTLAGRGGYIEKIEGDKAWVNMHDNSNDEKSWLPISVDDLLVNNEDKAEVLKERLEQLTEGKVRLVEGDEDFGVRYRITDKSDRIITKEKFFSTEEKMQKFIAKLEEKDNFVGIESLLKESENVDLMKPIPGKEYMLTKTGGSYLSRGNDGVMNKQSTPERALWNLEATDGSHLVNMTFTSPLEGEKFANKYGFPLKKEVKAQDAIQGWLQKIKDQLDQQKAAGELDESLNGDAVAEYIYKRSDNKSDLEKLKKELKYAISHIKDFAVKQSAEQALENLFNTQSGQQLANPYPVGTAIMGESFYSSNQKRRMGAPSSLSDMKPKVEPVKERKPRKGGVRVSYWEDKLRELEAERKDIMSDMENDPDVLDNPHDGSNPAVIMHGDKLEKIDNQIDRVKQKLNLKGLSDDESEMTYDQAIALQKKAFPNQRLTYDQFTDPSFRLTEGTLLAVKSFLIKNKVKIKDVTIASIDDQEDGWKSEIELAAPISKELKSELHKKFKTIVVRPSSILIESELKESGLGPIEDSYELIDGRTLDVGEYNNTLKFTIDGISVSGKETMKLMKPSDLEELTSWVNSVVGNLKESELVPGNVEGKAVLDEEDSDHPFAKTNKVYTDLAAAKKDAETMSYEGYVQHVNEQGDGTYKISDWYDDESTVASYEGGMQLNESDQSLLKENEEEIIKLYKGGKSQSEISDLGYDFDKVVSVTKRFGKNVGRDKDNDDRFGDDSQSKQYYDRTLKEEMTTANMAVLSTPAGLASKASAVDITKKYWGGLVERLENLTGQKVILKEARREEKALKELKTLLGNKTLTVKDMVEVFRNKSESDGFEQCIDALTIGIARKEIRCTNPQDGLLMKCSISQDKVLNEDVYYPTEPKVKTKKEIEQEYQDFIDEWVNNYIGEESAFGLVQYGGTSITIGARSYKDGEGKTTKRESDKWVWEDTGKDLIVDL